MRCPNCNATGHVCDTCRRPCYASDRGECPDCRERREKAAAAKAPPKATRKPQTGQGRLF